MSATRHRILCVRPKQNVQSAPFLNDLVCEWVSALQLHATVEVKDIDFDLKTVCEEFNPDLVVFEAFDWARPWPLTISNADTHPQIPRVLLLNNDPHDPMRPLIYSLFHYYRIEAIFQHAGPCHENLMPELSYHKRFTVPHMIDGEVFRDYGQLKTIPVSIFSAHLFPTFYDWRAQATNDLQQIFPTFLYTHPGYAVQSGQDSPFNVHKIAYAKLLNQSWFSVADTTRLDYGVRKHLEIPATGAVLVAPDSIALRDYGFRDLDNCLLGTGADLYRKIDAVCRQPELYESIRSAGHDLVHTKYTRHHWHHILDWLVVRRKAVDGALVVQREVYGPFSLTSCEQSQVSVETRENQMTAILRSARKAIVSGRGVEAAIKDLQRARTWIGHVAEPLFMLGVIACLQGQLVDGAIMIAQRSSGQGHLDASLVVLDPVEVAWVLLAAHLLGKQDLIGAMREHAKAKHHLSIRRVMWFFSDRRDDPAGEDHALHHRLPIDIPSIHWIGQESFQAWCGLVHRVCEASDRHDLLPLLEQWDLNSRDASLAE